MVCRVGFDIAVGHGLLQGFVEDAVEVADCLGRKALFGQGVVIALDGVGIQGVQFDSAQAGLDPGLDNALVMVYRARLDAAQVFGGPDTCLNSLLISVRHCGITSMCLI